MKRLAAAAGVLTVVLLLACRFPEEHTVEKSIDFGGVKRKYLLHVPPKAAKPAPVVLMFHGGGGDALSAERTGKWSELSDRDGFIVIYPEGAGRNWYDGRETDVSEAHREKRDDVGFVCAVLDAVAKEHAIDPKRVYATGISNGAFMSHYLAAKRSDRIAAIAPVVGGLADPFHKSFKPEKPVSVLIIQGSEDPLVPFDGGVVARNRGRLVATREAARLWREHDACAAEAKEDELPDRDPKDGCRVKRTTWSGGKDGTEVVLMTVEGGGHTWPDGQQYLPERLIGRVCRDIDTATVWEFFNKHPKP